MGATSRRTTRFVLGAYSEGPRLRPNHDDAAGRVRSRVFAGDLPGAAVHLDTVDIANGRVFVERAHLHAVDPPGRLALGGAGHVSEALERLLVTLHADAADGAEGVANRGKAAFLELVPAQVGAQPAPASLFEVRVATLQLLDACLH